MLKQCAPMVFGALLCACARDYRNEVAFHTLFSEDGQPDTAAIAGALSAKFPVGSQFGPLQSYVDLNGGSCRERPDGHTWCEITLRTKFCAASMLGIDVVVTQGSIGTLAVKWGGLSC